MLAEIINRLNWVDVFIIIVLVRTCYIALKGNLPTEAFKLLGTLLAIYLAFHYYTFVSDFVSKSTNIGTTMPLQFIDFLSFIFLFFIGYAIFVVIRELTAKTIKTEALPRFDKWGALAAGVIRAFLMSSVIMYALLISSVSYITKSTEQSYSGVKLASIGPAIYRFVWDNVMSKIMVNEKYNKAIDEVLSGEKKP